MALSCVVVPTLTTTDVSTSQSLVTTSTESISTAPSSVSTIVFSTCSPGLRCQPTTSFITLPGNAATVTVPAILTVNVPVTVKTTLFGTLCSTSSSSSSTSPTPTSTTSTSTPSSAPASSLSSTSTSSSISTSTLSTMTTSLPVVITPAPTLVTTNSLVTSDGSTFTSFFTSTSTNAAITANAQSTGNPAGRGLTPGPIIGGVLGGVAALLLLGLLTWRLVKKQPKFIRFFNHDEGGHHQNDPLLEKPSYKYGMVGLPTSNPFTLSIPDPPPAIQDVYGNGGGTASGQASGPQGTFGNDVGLSQSTAVGQTVIANGGDLGQASGQVAFGNDGGQASAQGAFGNDMGPGPSTTSGHGIFGNDAGLGQAAGPQGALGTGGGLGQTVSDGHGVVGNLPLISSDVCDPSILPLITGIGTAAVASDVYAKMSRPSSSRPSTASSSQLLGPLVTPAEPQGSYPTHRYGEAYAGPSTSSDNNQGDRPGPSATRKSSMASSISVYSHSSWIGNSSTNYNMGDDSGDGPPSLPSMGNPSEQAPSYNETGRPLNIPPEKEPLVHLDGTLYQKPSRSSSRAGAAPPTYFE